MENKNNDPNDFSNISLEMLLNKSPIAIWTIDRNHRFMSGNPHALRAAGVNSLEEFEEKTVFDLKSMKHWSLEKAQEFYDICEHVMKTGIKESLINDEVHPDSEPSFMNQAHWVMSRMLDKNGQVYGLTGVSFFNDELTMNTKIII